MNNVHRYWIASAFALFLVGGGAVGGWLISRSTENQGAGTLSPFDHPAFGNPEVAGKRVVERIVLEEPESAFNFELINMDGSKMKLEDFSGKLVLLGFIYTNCPDVCGLLTQHYRYIQRQFAREIGKELELMFITTDPERDTPRRLTAYTHGFGGKWLFFTGSVSQLEEVWKNYDIFVTEGKEGTDLVIHSYSVALIDRKGMIRYRYMGIVDPEEAIVKDIRSLIDDV